LLPFLCLILAVGGVRVGLELFLEDACESLEFEGLTEDVVGVVLH
jgi:hypothetical protein